MTNNAHVDSRRSDALVFFGATGDLVHKQIFPALYAMVKRGALNVPVIGIAYSKWDLQQLHTRVRDSVAQATSGTDDTRALDRLIALLGYVDGDYDDPATFKALKEALGNAERPAFYLAIPPPPGGPAPVNGRRPPDRPSSSRASRRRRRGRATRGRTSLSLRREGARRPLPHPASRSTDEPPRAGTSASSPRAPGAEVEPSQPRGRHCGSVGSWRSTKVPRGVSRP